MCVYNYIHTHTLTASSSLCLQALYVCHIMLGSWKASREYLRDRK